jgi:hypothetical protein
MTEELDFKNSEPGDKCSFHSNMALEVGEFYELKDSDGCKKSIKILQVIKLEKAYQISAQIVTESDA